MHTELRELKRFGLIFSCTLTAINLLRWAKAGYLHLWPLILAAVVFILALIRPQLLKPFHLFLRSIFHSVTAIILGLFFYLVITPVGLIMKLAKRDPLHRSFQKDRAIYWIPRDETLSDPKRMERQF